MQRSNHGKNDAQDPKQEAANSEPAAAACWSKRRTLPTESHIYYTDSESHTLAQTHTHTHTHTHTRIDFITAQLSISRFK